LRNGGRRITTVRVGRADEGRGVMPSKGGNDKFSKAERVTGDLATYWAAVRERKHR